jgi:hypothetical protein
MRYLVTGTSELACTACGQVHKGAKLVTLPDGTQVNNYSEAWRAHTEAKWVLEKLPLVVNRRRKSTPQISQARLHHTASSSAVASKPQTS